MTPLFLKSTTNKVLLVLLFSFHQLVGYSQSTILEKNISIPEYKGSAKELIDRIGEAEAIVFAYTNTVLLTYEVSFKSQQMTLRQFLDILFQGRRIVYKTNGNKVLLYYSNTDNANSSPLFQTVRGSLIDEDNRSPLIGATVMVLGTDPIVGTTSDLDGKFRLENVPIGRVDLQISYLGYEALNIPNLEVSSGKEVVLDLTMSESVLAMDEIVIRPYQEKGESLNDLVLLSARSISVEETKRYTGGMNDPARMVTSYAGVTATQDGSSDIIVRGNSPKYMQWRLEGIEITSPYHMDDQNVSYGALTAINKNLLTYSDFYTGAFSAEYGNVLSNVMDMNLRAGNNEKFEASFGIGLMGTDLTIEGPFKKSYSGSYLLNYRYSTIALVKDLGLLEGVEGIVNYQDVTFKAVFPTKRFGRFSMFGLGGVSGFAFENIAPNFVTTPGKTTDASILKDYDKQASLSNAGVNHTIGLGQNSYIKTSLSYSANGFDDDLYEKNIFKENVGQSQSDSVGERTQTFESRVSNSAYRASIIYYNRINAKNKVQVGSRYTVSSFDYFQNIYKNETEDLVSVTDFNNNINTMNNFISWKYSFNDKLTFISGLHNMNVLYNTKSTLEPRIAMNWELRTNFSVHAGYGKHSTMERVHNYFTRVPNAGGGFTEPNKNLGLLMADHYILGFKKRFTENVMLKLELYYQHLYDLPVDTNDTSYYATINEGTDYQYVPLVNKGVGENYGVELTLERFFDNNYYFLLNGSLYQSKYKTLEGVWRNTKYNGNYIVNLLGGKEFKNLGKNNNKILAINAKAFVGGGQRYIPLLRDAGGNVAVDPESNRYWDYQKAYDNKLVHIYNVNFSVSYKINSQRATHEIFLDFMNVIRSKAHLSEYYDESKQGQVGYVEQMIFFPNLMYKVYF